MIRCKLFLDLLLIILLPTVTLSLEHEKNFLLRVNAAAVWSLAFYKDSVLITTTNDIVQKSLDTGSIQRTFRGHNNRVRSIVAINETTLISGGWDDMIIMWSLETGSVIRRISFGSSYTLIEAISVENDLLFAGGADERLRFVNLATGRLLDVSSTIYSVVSSGDSLFVWKKGGSLQLEKYQISTGFLLMWLEGHTNSISALCLSGDLLFSAAAELYVFSWRAVTGERIGEFFGHTGKINALIAINDELFGGSNKYDIFKWSLVDGSLLITFEEVHRNGVICLDYRDGMLLSGSTDTHTLQWNTTLGVLINTFRSEARLLRTAKLWKNYILSAVDDSQVRFLDVRLDNLVPYAVLTGHTTGINCLFLEDESLFSGDSDSLIIQWSLTNLTAIKNFVGHRLAVNALKSENGMLYSGGSDVEIRRWNISTASQTGSYLEHLSLINTLQTTSDLLCSGSSDGYLILWDKQSTAALVMFEPFYDVRSSVMTSEALIVGTSASLLMYDLSSLEVLAALEGMFEEIQTAACFCLAAGGFRVYSGHDDSSIRVRDSFTLFVLESYIGHNDAVNSVFLMRTTFFTHRALMEQSSDGICSVTALAVAGNRLIVGTKMGSLLSYGIDNAIVLDSRHDHLRAVSSIVNYDGYVLSSGLDGRIVKLDLGYNRNDSVLFNFSPMPIYGLLIIQNTLFSYAEIISPNNSTEALKIISSAEPISCLAATESFIMAGSKSGSIFGWQIDSLLFSFELKSHTSEVNFLLADRGSLYSASEDKTIIEWSIADKSQVRVLQRQSSSILGHLGPVNSLSICRGVLFSGSSDLSVRRWNLETGRHQDVYFGFTKPVTSVLCNNISVFAGSDDFSVLMFQPNLPKEDILTYSTITSAVTRPTRKQKAIVKSVSLEGSRNITNQTIAYILAAVVVILVIGITLMILRRRTTKKATSPAAITTTSMDATQTMTDLETVINTVVGISKHAAYLIESSFVAKAKKLTSGGGGELILANIMDATLRKKFGEIVVQKMVFIRNNTIEEAFYQEVGVMIMLLTFPHFWLILGYTEKPLSMILKYYPDGSLFEFFCKHKLKTSYILKILKEVAYALNIMHSHYLVHCDIKSQNVLIEFKEGIPTCYLTDFGITQILSDRIIATKAFNVINLRGLSVPYAAPEAFINFRSKKYSSTDFKKYDIYSLACAMLEVLTQQTPWSLN